MTYGLNLVQRLEDTALGVGEQFKHGLDALGMVGHGLVDYNFILARGTVGNLPHLESDSFHKSLGQKGIVVSVLHVEDLILQR